MSEPWEQLQDSCKWHSKGLCTTREGLARRDGIRVARARGRMRTPHGAVAGSTAQERGGQDARTIGAGGDWSCSLKSARDKLPGRYASLLRLTSTVRATQGVVLSASKGMQHRWHEFPRSCPNLLHVLHGCKSWALDAKDSVCWPKTAKSGNLGVLSAIHGQQVG